MNHAIDTRFYLGTKRQKYDLGFDEWGAVIGKVSWRSDAQQEEGGAWGSKVTPCLHRR
jgi:hypothetical protein